MKKFYSVLAVGVVLVLAFVVNVVSDPVAPATAQITCLRNTGSSSAISTTNYYQGNTLSLSNSVMFTGAIVSAATQNLEGCSIWIVAGQPGATNNVYTNGYLINTNNGLWGADFIIPAYNPCYVEVTVSNVGIFTYPRYRLNTQDALPRP